MLNSEVFSAATYIENVFNFVFNPVLVNFYQYFSLC